MGYPVRSHLEPHGDVQPPHDPADMSPPGSHLPQSPVRHPSVIHHPLGAADRPHPARPPSCRQTATVPHLASHPAPQIDATRLAGPVPAHRQPPGQLSRIPPAPSPPVRIPHGFRQTDTHMIRVISPRPYAPRPTAPIPARSTGPTRLDHTGPMCTAPTGPVPTSPIFDHQTYAMPTSTRTRGGNPVTFRQASSDHGSHVGSPCVHPS